MHSVIANTFPGVMLLEVSPTVISTCAAGVALIVIGVWVAKNDILRERGLDKVVALTNMFFAMPLAVFGAEHFADAKGIMELVPKFMPWPLFWTYLVGLALVATSLSIATKIEVRWSGVLFGIMMFLFVAMMDLPATIQNLHDRITWALFFRELSFGSGGWILAGTAMRGSRSPGWGRIVAIGRIVIGIAAMFYGVEHFLHPLNVPGVPLEKLMPVWIPARRVISYFTGALLLATGACILQGKKTRVAATYLGTWIVLLVICIYGPILTASLLDPSTAVKVEGINYFADTLLYGGTILTLAANKSGAPQRAA